MKTISNGVGFAILIGGSLLGCIDDFSHPGDDYGNGSGGGKRNGTTCTSLCERSKECADSSLVGKDCSDYCAKIETLNRNAGCAAEFDDIVQCDATVSNVCAPPEDACRAEIDAYLMCFTAYCTDHAQECADAAS